MPFLANPLVRETESEKRIRIRNERLIRYNNKILKTINEALINLQIIALRKEIEQMPQEVKNYYLNLVEPYGPIGSSTKDVTDEAFRRMKLNL